MKNWIAGALVAVLAIATVVGVAIAQEEPPDPPPEPDPVTVNVEVRVWQDVNNARNIYISARPAGGDWAALGTIPLPLDDGISSSGRFRYGDISVGVPVGSATATVEVRVWQDVNDALRIYVSARPENGSWATLGTIPLPLDDGYSSSGRYRYGDIVVAVTLGALPTPTPAPTPTPTPAPWVDPRPDNTYTLRALATMPEPEAPQPPPRPDHVVALAYGGGPNIGVYLVDPSRVVIEAIHNYNSRSYALLCDDSSGYNYASCNYSGLGPLSDSGTWRLTFWYTEPGPDEIELSSVLVDGVEVTCEERPATYWYGEIYERHWWCYDPATYRAWERARDRALAPPADPLQRYLRAQGEAPLWYQASPYSGAGSTTTGVFTLDPYVGYGVALSHTGDSLDVQLGCVALERRDDFLVIAEVFDTSVWDGREFFIRETALCEFEIEADGEWTVDLSEVVEE